MGVLICKAKLVITIMTSDRDYRERGKLASVFLSGKAGIEIKFSTDRVLSAIAPIFHKNKILFPF